MRVDICVINETSVNPSQLTELIAQVRCIMLGKVVCLLVVVVVGLSLLPSDVTMASVLSSEFTVIGIVIMAIALLIAVYSALKKG